MALDLGNYEIVKILVDHGAKFNDIGLFNRAIMSGNLEIFKLLLDNDVNLNMSKMDLVVCRGNMDMVKYAASIRPGMFRKLATNFNISRNPHLEARRWMLDARRQRQLTEDYIYPNETK